MEYSILKTLGKGSYGEVSLAKDPANRYVAIKKPRGRTSLKHERDMLELIRTKGGFAGIPRLLDTVSNGGDVRLVIEYIEGQPLADIEFKSQSLSVVTTYITQLATIVAGLHTHGIHHNDLHDGNMLLSSDGHMFVLDFGEASVADRHKERSFNHDTYAIIGIARDWINQLTHTECKRKECVQSWLQDARYNKKWVNEDAGVFLQRWETMLQSMDHHHFPLIVTCREFPRSSDHPF